MYTLHAIRSQICDQTGNHAKSITTHLSQHIRAAIQRPWRRCRRLSMSRRHSASDWRLMTKARLNVGPRRHARVSGRSVAPTVIKHRIGSLVYRPAAHLLPGVKTPPRCVTNCTHCSILRPLGSYGSRTNRCLSGAAKTFRDENWYFSQKRPSISVTTFSRLSLQRCGWKLGRCHLLYGGANRK